MKKILFSVLIGLLAYWAIGLLFPSLVQAQSLPSFTWVVTDQDGNPLSGAVVWINLNGTYIATCTTGASGQCSETISCAPPCQLNGNVEWQGQTGSYGGAFSDGAIISVTIGVPSVSPSPPPGPSPSPSPGCAGYGESCLNKECCEPYEEQFSEQTGACTCVFPATPGPNLDSLTCRPQLTGERDSRPYFNSDPRCDLCNATGMFCSSCATSFTVGTTVDWQWKDKNCEDDGTIWWQAGWGGTVTIDPTETKIPFVGKKREADPNAREDEQKYLADYFDGTHEYYRTYDVRAEVNIPFLGRQLEFTAFHGTNTTLLPNYQGVFRKLTPMEYQDQLKIKMVERAKETIASGGEPQSGGIHDYNVSYKPRLCWDLSFFGDAVIGFANSIAGSEVMELGLGEINTDNLSDFFSFLASISHYCVYNFGGDDLKLTTAKGAIDAFNVLISSLGPFGNLFKIQTEGKIDGVEKTLTEIDGHFPPEPDEEDFAEKWQEWKNSEWGRVWEAVPMVSREDTPGWISPYYNYRRLDEPKSIEPRVEKVPHVARLYESSQEIQNILLPSTEEGLISQKKTEPIIASPGEEKILGEKTLLAQASCGKVCPIDIQFYSLPPAAPGRYTFPWGYCFPCDCGGIGDAQNLRVWDSGGSSGGTPILAIGGGMQCNEQLVDAPWGTGYSPSEVDMQVGSTFTVSVSCEKTQSRKEDCCHDGGSGSCSITLKQDDQGNYYWEVTCGVITPPEIPACATPEGFPVNQCELTAITDSNPNDSLCCNLISLEGMSFKDAFIDHNPEYTYTECTPECDCCSPPKPDGCQNPCVCDDDPCLTPVSKEVTRDWGINLSHPYLTPIWEQTAKSESGGIFNIFRPAQIPPFEELDAYSTIDYGFTGGWIEPSEGKFYYNYLGGVQKAKEWVTTKVLMPYVKQ